MALGNRNGKEGRIVVRPSCFVMGAVHVPCAAERHPMSYRSEAIPARELAGRSRTSHHAGPGRLTCR